MLRKRERKSQICKLGRVEVVDILVYRLKLKLTRLFALVRFQIISYFDLAIAECMFANKFFNNTGLLIR
jgi:hypothetical protein